MVAVTSVREFGTIMKYSSRRQSQKRLRDGCLLLMGGRAARQTRSGKWVMDGDPLCRVFPH